MNAGIRWTIIGLVVIALIAIVVMKRGEKPEVASATVNQETTDTVSTVEDIPCAECIELTEEVYQQDHAPAELPRLVELGSVTCQNCKKMAVILDEIEKKYDGKLIVEFYDVKKDPEIGKLYGIRLIPAQVFIDTSGKEVFRHEGFFTAEEIEGVLVSMGITQ